MQRYWNSRTLLVLLAATLVATAALAPHAPASTVSVTRLANGLNGAIGSDYEQGRNRLDFVEYATGKLSTVDVVRPTAGLVSSGTATIHGTFSFDFDGGVEGSRANPRDVFWRQHTTVERWIEVIGTARTANLGVRTLAQFNAITATQLQALTYTSANINGNDDATNQLVAGDVFAVRTDYGNYAKVQVVTYGYDLQVRWVTYKLSPAYHVLGTGYSQPEDVEVTASGQYAYITERTGTLVKVNLALAPNANRSAAAVITSSLTAPHQMFLDEAHNQAYVVEYANPGRLLRIDLATGVETPLLSDLQYGIGLVLTSNLQFAYITEQIGAVGRLSRINLGTLGREPLYTSATAPLFHLVFTDAGEGGLLTTERDPANTVWKIDVAQNPAVATELASAADPGPAGSFFRPSSVAVFTPDQLFMCSDSQVNLLGLSGSVFTATGPLFLGIGHVPVDRIINSSPASVYDGYADTTGDPGYFFQVKDSPFGGSLPIMVNHELAYSLGAEYYKVEVDGVAQTNSWSDYKWDAAQSKFVLQTITPTGSGFYPVRQPGELWYNHWLGLFLDTSPLSNSIHTINIRLFNAPFFTEASYPPRLIRSRRVRIDNVAPTAQINRILHLLPDGSTEEVSTCGIVDTPTNKFQFDITAYDGVPGHLLSWSFDALYGDNQSSHVDSDTYVPGHVSATHRWSGIQNTVVPLKPWAAPVNCAYTFYLSVWDRAINGYGYIHYATYHKSITILSVPTH